LITKTPKWAKQAANATWGEGLKSEAL